MGDSDDGSTPAKVQRLSSSVTEISSEADSSIINVETQKALEEIDSCQNEIDSLNEKASEEILLIEQKYNKLRKPHFEKRNDLIKQIPNFWVTTFINHPQISHLISRAEEKCLQYLTQMEVSEFEDIKSGYSISFHFNKNPYFSNEVISKSYFLALKDSRPNSKSSDIRWRDGKDLSKTFQSKKVQRRVPGIGSRVGSFFSWFAENGNPLYDKVADILKDDIWPNPLQYYLAPDIEVEENGETDGSDDDDDDDGDSVVIVGDDDSDDDGSLNDDDVYEVDDLDDTGDTGMDSVELLEVEDDDEDDDDDDDVEVIEDDSELETTADMTTDLETTGVLDTSQTDGEEVDTSQVDDESMVSANASMVSANTSKSQESLVTTDVSMGKDNVNGTVSTIEPESTAESSKTEDIETDSKTKGVNDEIPDSINEGETNEGKTDSGKGVVTDEQKRDEPDSGGATPQESGGGDG